MHTLLHNCQKAHHCGSALAFYCLTVRAASLSLYIADLPGIFRQAALHSHAAYIWILSWAAPPLVSLHVMYMVHFMPGNSQLSVCHCRAAMQRHAEAIEDFKQVLLLQPANKDAQAKLHAAEQQMTSA